ncbi:MAG: S8 family serine peptidase [Actinomycetota bacterium]|nr:S8 family serine peptidase [Actinomycetota bacterium]
MAKDNGNGTPFFREDHPDPRDAAQRLADKDGVRRQCAGLGREAATDGYRREILAAVQVRRAQRSDRLSFHCCPGPEGRDMSVVTGELLVRSDVCEDSALLGALAPYGFSSAPIEELEGRVLRLVNAEIGVDKLQDIARFIRGSGHQASVNHVTPLGPIMKGRGGPENTAGVLPYPPTFAGQATGPAVKLAVIDTGVTEEQRTDGWLNGLATAANTDPLDDLPRPNGFLDFGAGHGTFTAGVVAQIAPDCELAMYRAVDSDGIGSETDVACAMLQAVEEGATILNLSLGEQTADDQPLLAIEVALDLITERNPEVLVFAAAGNDGSSRPCWPAASKRVVAVAALAADLTPAPWSNRGFWVDCSAVGEGVVSTYVQGEEAPELDPSPDTFGADAWAVWSGTSFASPQVAAAVARLAHEDGCPPREALRTLFSRSRALPDFGWVVPILPGT